MIDPTAKIDCNHFEPGEGTIIRAHAEIYGDTVILGRESFIDEYAVVGGGSAGNLTTGDWFHLGMFAQVNTARPVTIGHEVGLGIGTRVFTHGAYLSEWDGFPVSFDSVHIYDRVWVPNAIVLPGTYIGSDTVIAAGSVVTGDLEGGGLYGGTPAKLIREGFPQPNRLSILTRICDEAGVGTANDDAILCEATLFEVNTRRICGPVTEASERVRNQLRRHGIRFRYEPSEKGYRPW